MSVRYYEKEFDHYDPPCFRIRDDKAAIAVVQLPAVMAEQLNSAINPGFLYIMYHALSLCPGPGSNLR
jgi:hypothetical protein